MADYDLITDILQRLTAKGVPVPATVAHAVDVEARREWGGKRHYIPSRGELQQQQVYQRDTSIRASLLAGCSVPELARAWGISERRVRQIGHL
jgi:Mor family transcriptional regulator